MDKVVIVTGAGSGIGAATAIKFAKEGANVAIVGRNKDKLRATAEICSESGKEVLIIAADVSKDEDAKRIIQATIDKFSKLDVLVNNAGIARFGSICQGDVLAAYDAVLNTNLRAVLHLITLATPYLTVTKGNIINISSVLGSTAVCTDLLTYNISKAALDHLTRCAALELAPRGVRVNAVSPGPVVTDIIKNSDLSLDFETFKMQTALNRVGESQEIADLVLFLASDKAKGVTGSNYLSDNGMLLKC